VARAVVVGLKDAHYGEVVGAFVEYAPGATPQPDDQALRAWVKERLGGHKAPAHVFWLGQGGVPADVPLTGSGKVRKFEMAKLGNELLARASKL
jgi:acyl-CoA synthetase (AMP-forming)/AMP-acid ligase II